MLDTSSATQGGELRVQIEKRKARTVVMHKGYSEWFQEVALIESSTLKEGSDLIR